LPGVSRIRISTLPAACLFEVANICLKKMRRHPALRDQLASAFGMLAGLGITMIEIDHGETLELAGRTGLTAYGASYLWLAQRLGPELVTLDRRLKSVAARSV